MSSVKRILLIPGDGIGPEVMAEAVSLLQVIEQKLKFKFQLDQVDWGAERWLREGVGLPSGTLESLSQAYDAILFGALGDPRIPDMAHGREILLGLRFGLDLFINLRPIKLLSPSLSTLKDRNQADIDMVIFRENTEDVYLGLGQSEQTGLVNEVVVDESRHSFRGVARIIEAAFSYAKAENRRRVTLVDKSNAIKFGGRLWQRAFKEIKEKYPELEADHLFVDVAAMKMVQDPKRFDVIVTSNLFGDILSDLGAGLIGGLGLAPSANIHPNVIALFEPVHGSAPDLVGKNLANPFAMFLSVAMMMSYFGHPEIARLIEKTIAKAIDNKNSTPDLGGKLSCQMASAMVIKELLS